jgi:hypothetical protein
LLAPLPSTGSLRTTELHTPPLTTRPPRTIAHSIASSRSPST